MFRFVSVLVKHVAYKTCYTLRPLSHKRVCSLLDQRLQYSFSQVSQIKRKWKQNTSKFLQRQRWIGANTGLFPCVVVKKREFLLTFFAYIFAFWILWVIRFLGILRSSGCLFCETIEAAFDVVIGSLSTRVFETRTATGREHFACQDSGVSQIFKLLVSNGEKILSNVNLIMLKQVKRENSSLPVAVRVSKKNQIGRHSENLKRIALLIFFVRINAKF